MHTAEHILNQTMVRMFGCPRSRNAHIERKKSKCDYLLDACPDQGQVQAIEDKVNDIISAGLPVTADFVPLSEAGATVDLSKLPENVSETLRIVRIGDYDACACAGAHVSNTSEIGRFRIINGLWLWEEFPLILPTDWIPCSSLLVFGYRSLAQAPENWIIS